MQNLFIITSIGFFLWMVRNTLFWVELWQSKEYRLDRLSVHFRETVQGKRLLVSPLSTAKWLLIFLYGFVVFNDKYTFYYDILIGGLYCIEGVRVLWEAKSGYKLRRPARTAKALAIIFLSLLFIIILYFLPMTEQYLWLLLLDRILILVIALFVFFFAFPTEIYTDIKIQKAHALLKKHKKLLVIAISGSYGKSSTKEFVAQILKEKYNVVKTYGSNNTPIGIANTVLAHITNATDIFVVEMGAYKLGEVAELCEFAQPNISVTTSISDQHLSLFGNVKNAIHTEEELIHALPKNGLALFNGNNELTQKVYQKTKKKKILYKVITKKEKEVAIAAMNVKQQKDAIMFDLLINDKKMHMQTPLLGEHMVQNILPAIFIAHHLKISMPVIKKAVMQLIPPPKTMMRKISPNGVTLIDDTFNASPESVKAAMSYMNVYKKKKIFVLTPLIELGKHAPSRHYDIGLQASNTSDYLFLTNKNFYRQIKKGIEDGNGKCIVKVGKTTQLIEDIIALARKDDVVVFEGKEAGKVLQNLL